MRTGVRQTRSEVPVRARPDGRGVERGAQQPGGVRARGGRLRGGPSPRRRAARVLAGADRRAHRLPGRLLAGHPGHAGGQAVPRARRAPPDATDARHHALGRSGAHVSRPPGGGPRPPAASRPPGGDAPDHTALLLASFAACVVLLALSKNLYAVMGLLVLLVPGERFSSRRGAGRTWARCWRRSPPRSSLGACSSSTGFASWCRPSPTTPSSSGPGSAPTPSASSELPSTAFSERPCCSRTRGPRWSRTRFPPA